MFVHGFPPEWSSLKKLIWLKAIIGGGGGAGIWKTVTGTLIHITDALASPMQKCEVTLEPIQSGSGDPSPTNVRPITGWTGTSVKLSPIQPDAQGVITLSPIQAGEGNPTPTNIRPITAPLTFTRDDNSTVTVYDGTLDTKNRILVSNADMATLTHTMSWERVGVTASSSYFYLDDPVVNGKSAATWSNVETIGNWASKTVSKNIEQLANGKYYWTTTTGAWRVGYGTATTTLEQFLAFLQNSPLQILCQLNTPVTYNLSETELNRALNAIGGGVYSVTFPALGSNLVSFVGVSQKTNNGITYTPNANGSITVYGTASPNTSFGVESNRVSLKAGTYTVIAQNATNVRTVVTNSSGTLLNKYIDGDGSLDVTLETDDTLYLYLRVSKNNVVDTTMTAELKSHTVYGGTYDFVSGVLTVDRVEFDGGAATWTKTTGNNYRNFSTTTELQALYKNNVSTVMCEIYASTNNNDASPTADNYVWLRGSQTNNTVAVKDTSKASLTVDEFKAAMTGVKFVYYLYEPIEIELTPQQISTLARENNVWGDGNIELTYKAQA